jgi:2-dehydropantoate 2-reductase
MKVCIFGAGALGGHLAAQLISQTQADVSLVARGAHLKAIQSQGISLTCGDRQLGGRAFAATDKAEDLPPQDIVFVALKAQTLAPLATAIASLIKPEGCVVFLLNGIPWWWNYGLDNNKTFLPLLDPSGALWKAIDPQRVIGSVVYSPNEVVAPGVIKNSQQNRWIFGEPNGTDSERLNTIIQLVRSTGVQTESSLDIRREIWKKLANNASNNTLCSLTRLDSTGVAGEEGLVHLAISIINETLSVAAQLGWDMSPDVNVQQVATRAKGKPGQRPSTLQDVLAGKSLEIDALIGQTQAFAREMGLATPVIDVCLTLLRGLDVSLRSSSV